MKAPATDRGGSAATLVLCGHGTRGAGGVLDRHAALIRARGQFADVRVCSLYGTPGLGEMLLQIETPEVCVVPWLMCAGFTMDRLAAAITSHPAADRVTLAAPVGADPAIADLAAELAKDRCRDNSWAVSETGLLLVGHGSGRNTVSAETTRCHAAAIAATGTFAAVATAFLDEPPSPAAALAAMGRPACVAVGLFAERSLHGEDDVPRLLGTGSNVVYTGPIGTVPALAEIVIAKARAARPARPRDAA